MNCKYYLNRGGILFIDGLLMFFSFYLAHMVRFDFNIPQTYLNGFVNILPYLLIFKIAAFWYFDLYRGMWRYTSLNDIANIIWAIFLSSTLIIGFVFWRYRFENISRSVFLMDACFTFVFTCGIRILTRLVMAQDGDNFGFKRIMHRVKGLILNKPFFCTRALIIGAGRCGDKISREIKEYLPEKYNVVGFLDDDIKKVGRKINGINVIDTINNIADAVEKTGATEIIIAASSVCASRTREIMDLCKECDIKFKRVPAMGEFIDGTLSIKSIRDLKYSDLLKRKPVNLDNDKTGRYLTGKTVLVTGAGGSIGSGLCKQIANYAPDRLILFERAESPLYEIELELSKAFKDILIIPCLADIQDSGEVHEIFKKFRPDIVFHAAAYKHVPMLEHHPWKAVENNISGTENLVDAASAYKCKKFVFVSTDKAVNPTNIMGASKRVAEMVVQNRSKLTSETNFITVRFGNVIGSIGSVIPLFEKQIKNGGPVTVTHPDMVRYFMLIPEACQLILQAGAMGKGGEIFILDMGEPVNIDEMARDLIRFSGFEPDKDINIEYVGLRPGEKLFEELMKESEDVLPTRHESILVLNSEKCDMKKINGNLDILKHAAMLRNCEMIKSGFKDIVMEYQPTGCEFIKKETKQVLQTISNPSQKITQSISEDRIFNATKIGLQYAGQSKNRA